MPGSQTWQIVLMPADATKVFVFAKDKADNTEQPGHDLIVASAPARVAAK